MRTKILAVVVTPVLLLGGYQGYQHHLGAPALPYGPCTGGSVLTYYWFPGDRYPHGAEGTEYYLGSTEVASCSGVLTATAGSAPGGGGGWLARLIAHVRHAMTAK